MKFTFSWLKDHLETDKSLDEIVNALTMIGLEVESVDDRSAMNAFVVAKVLTAKKHPDADKLQVLSVDTGSGTPVQVVCGAPNAKADMLGVFAPSGCYIPGLDTTLSVGKIRGVDSYGMLCSEQELKLSNAHNGIIELNDNAPVGISFATYAGLNDPIIDVAITPNRADCTGVRGIARDLAAAGMGTFKELSRPNHQQTQQPAINVKLDTAVEDALCLGFSWCTIKNVNNGASPQWLQQRLIAIGQTPINQLVDLANYMTFDLGHPLHVFDADKLNGALVVRRAHDGEAFLALNGKQYSLNHNHCVIADDHGVQALSGIIGAKASSCDDNTTNILIESALWQPQNIAHTGRALAIHSDARYRFERGVDPAFMVNGLQIMLQKTLDLCAGQPSNLATLGEQTIKPKEIDFRLSEVKRLTSLDIAQKDIVAILKRLGFSCNEKDGGIIVSVPTWRPDVHVSADLVEEVMRIYGIENIIPQPLTMHQAVNSKILTTSQLRSRAAKRALASRGMLEVITWSFIAHNQAKAFGGGATALQLANPIAEDMSDMRPSLLPGLITAAQRNADRGFADSALFEVSDIYLNDEASGQKNVASGIRRGSAQLNGAGRFWAGNAQTVNVFDAKADAFSILEACGMQVSKLQVETGAPAWYHPGRSGVIKLGPKIILGHFGEIHPDYHDMLNSDGPLCGFEIFMDAIPAPKVKATKTRPTLSLSTFQTVKRDFAFIVDKSVTAASIVRAVSGADKKLIQTVQIFDLFENDRLGSDKKSIAFEVSLHPQDRTLTDDAIKVISTKIIDNVIKTTGGVLRS